MNPTHVTKIITVHMYKECALNDSHISPTTSTSRGLLDREWLLAQIAVMEILYVLFCIKSTNVKFESAVFVVLMKVELFSSVTWKRVTLYVKEHSSKHLLSWSQLTVVPSSDKVTLLITGARGLSIRMKQIYRYDVCAHKAT